MTALSPHQTRVLAAMAILERERGHGWWDRDAIGLVVSAGGYHQTIQRRTMHALKQAGLVRTERSAWPEEVRGLVCCHCACSQWGLSDEGRSVIDQIAVRFTGEAMERVRRAFTIRSAALPLRDEDEPLDDDDEEQEENAGIDGL